MIKKLPLFYTALGLIVIIFTFYSGQDVNAAGGYWQFQTFLGNGHCGSDDCSTMEGSPCSTLGATTACCETGWIRNRLVCAY